MTIDTPEIGKAIASPTKSFFVKMLTRDIELADALLDLLDNCVDGIIRKGNTGETPEKPYQGYKARIVINPDYFIIEDNCGGIPIETARKYAFAIGKPEGSAEVHSTATVGMYGIGMKRAIFKIGTEAIVESQHDTGFMVEFSPDWMKTDTWENLPIHELPKNGITNGTKIIITQLTEDAKPYFSDPEYVESFRKTVSQHYALIIDKGFDVVVATSEDDTSEEPIIAERFRLIAGEEDSPQSVQPFIYVGEIDGVSVEIYAGLYRELLSEEEIEAEEDTRGNADDAGWTIACNDRIVVWKDKSRLTGWGESDVPNYHGQFIAITGIVLLRSEDPKKLPLTTTKRGVDAATNIYSEVKDLMKEVTKTLTSFTNKWKKFPGGLEEIYKKTIYKELSQIRSMTSTVTLSVRRKTPSIRKYFPAYPEPPTEKTNARVVFTARKDEITVVSSRYFGDEKIKPGVVGEAAFKEILEIAKRN